MGGAGCICPESTILRTLVTHILLRRNEVVLLDLYAGVEHLGRATADAVDALLIVVEPTARSLGTAEQIKTLAGDLKLTRLYLIGSKVQNDGFHPPAVPRAARARIPARRPGCARGGSDRGPGLRCGAGVGSGGAANPRLAHRGSLVPALACGQAQLQGVQRQADPAPQFGQPA